MLYISGIAYCKAWKEVGVIMLDSILKLFTDLPYQIDLTTQKDSDHVLALANSILIFEPTVELLEQVETKLKSSEDSSLIAHLAVKIAKSKLLVNDLKPNSSLTICFVMYKEHNRIVDRAIHPHGENFLVRKVEQLRWLFSERSDIFWKIIALDDGCPEGSGKIANEIIKREELADVAEVLFLKDAIDQKLSIVNSISDVSDSQKAGSVQLGMWKAVQEDPGPNHVVAFTNAALSTHLGQVGLLMHPIINEEKLSAIGSRREDNSIVIKKGARNSRGKLFIFFWKQLIQPITYITDTQCGFKAFSATIIESILKSPIERKFAFDIELLLQVEKIKSNSIKKVPVAWFDSEAASTTTDLSPYLSMLKEIVKMYKTYLDQVSDADHYAKLIESLSEEDFETLINNIPRVIADGDPQLFNNVDGITPEVFTTILDK